MEHHTNPTSGLIFFEFPFFPELDWRKPIGGNSLTIFEKNKISQDNFRTICVRLKTVKVFDFE
jgi:hypothetical protein